MPLTPNDIQNRQVVKDLVHHINPTYRVEFSIYKYERWDASVYNPGGQIVAYIESKVRYESIAKYGSAMVGIAKAHLREKSKKAPVFVVSWDTKDKMVYLFPFARDGELNPQITRQGKHLLLPFKHSWCYSYKNRTLKFLSKPTFN